jgi:hypothetical protein
LKERLVWRCKPLYLGFSLDISLLLRTAERKDAYSQRSNVVLLLLEPTT